MLLLPRALEQFILRDQAEDLLSAPGVVAVEPARIPYGAQLRLPASVGDGLAATQARRLRLPGVPRAIVIFHPLQYPLARGLIAQHPDAELWYWRWDRYEVAYDANARQRARLEELHLAASLRAAVTVVVSDALGELAREEGSEPLLVPLAADSFPAPAPGETVVAVSLGHLGHRTDWKLLREVAEGMPELILLLIGAVARAGVRRRRGLPGAARRGQRRLAGPPLGRGGGAADPARRRRDRPLRALGVQRHRAALPDPQVRPARPPHGLAGLAGVRTWERAVTVAESPEEWIAALRAQAGVRTRPDAELRAWALAQTAHTQNRPLWERMEALGIESGRLGSERAQQRLNALRRPCLASGVKPSPGRLTLGEVPAAKP